MTREPPHSGADGPALIPRRLRVADEVVSILRETILQGLDGEYAPGTQLTEVSTAQELGVSRTTLREAFELLAREGILSVSRHRGTYVSEVKVEDIREIFRVRRALELRAIEEFHKAPPESAPLLKEAVDELEAAAASGLWRNVAEADLLFHERLVASLGSSLLTETYAQVKSRLLLCMLVLDYRGHIDRDSLIADSKHPLVAEHREFLYLIADGRRDEAKRKLEQMLALNEEYLLTMFGASEPADSPTTPRPA